MESFVHGGSDSAKTSPTVSVEQTKYELERLVQFLDRHRTRESFGPDCPVDSARIQKFKDALKELTDAQDTN